MSRYCLFIDDERYPPRNDGRNWHVARNWDDVLMCLRIQIISYRWGSCVFIPTLPPANLSTPF